MAMSRSARSVPRPAADVGPVRLRLVPPPPAQETASPGGELPLPRPLPPGEAVSPATADWLTGRAQAARGGDRKAMAELWIALEPRFRRWAWRRVGWWGGDPGPRRDGVPWALEDLRQEGFLVLAEVVAGWSGEGDFLPRFWKVAPRRLSDRWRAMRLRLELAGPEPSPWLADGSAAAEEAAALLAALAAGLDPLDGALLQAHVGEGRSLPAAGRALAYIAHEHLGEIFGTVYDVSTILILWFAGASAMAGLLNIVPRYLPRYGMAPTWSRATRPLVLVFTAICFVVTILFKADVNAQAGAYATGVLAVITSATVAVTLSAKRANQKAAMIWFGLVALIFIYTTGITIVSDPNGLQIAGLFVLGIVIVSLISRVMRSTELRTTEVSFDDDAHRFIAEAGEMGPVRVIANHPDERTSREYLLKEREEREASHIPTGDPVLFLEVTVRDASDFAGSVRVDGEDIGGFRVLKAEASSVPNAIAAVLLAIRDQTGRRPHAYFGWTEGNPLKYLTRFVLFGEGDIAPVTREVLRQAEPDPARRPAVHIG